MRLTLLASSNRYYNFFLNNVKVILSSARNFWEFIITVHSYLVPVSIYPNATSSTIIKANPTATPMVPILVCSPFCDSGISSSTTT